MPKELLIEGGNVVTVDPEIGDLPVGDVLVRDGTIVDVGPNLAPSEPDAEVIDAQGRLAGIVTDGDLRRHMRPDLMVAPVDEVMTVSPRVTRPDTLAVEALAMLNSQRITALFVVDEAGKPCGIVHFHDLLRLGAA